MPLVPRSILAVLLAGTLVAPLPLAGAFHTPGPGLASASGTGTGWATFAGTTTGTDLLIDGYLGGADVRLPG